MKELVEVIQLYLNNLKGRMIEDTDLDVKITTDFKEFEKDVEKLH